MDTSTIQKIIKEIENLSPVHQHEHVGKVISVGDGVVALSGLSGAVMSEILVFEEGKGKKLADTLGERSELYGLVLNLEEDGVRATVLGDSARVAEGMTVKSTGKILSVPSGEELLGRVVNALGEPAPCFGDVKQHDALRSVGRMLRNARAFFAVFQIQNFLGRRDSIHFCPRFGKP